jgi:hypothetical protein
VSALAVTACNNAVRASARLRRAPEYTAPKLCSVVSGVVESSGAWLKGARAGAASRTSERYLKSSLGSRRAVPPLS